MEKEGNNFLFKEIAIRVKQNNKVLEVGSGYCYLLSEIVEKFDVIGYGIDPYGKESQNEKLKCLRLSGEHISSLNEKFEIIFSIRSFHHLSNIDKFFEEASKSLKNDGVLIIVDWKMGADTGITERYYSLEEMRVIFQRNGFKIVSQEEGRNTFLITGEKI